MRNLSILSAPAVLLLVSCTTAVEEKNAAMYEPVFPVAEVPVETGLPSGSIYGTRSAGIFATDRRASQVGDILTVELTERFAASKAQSAGNSKSDSFTVDLPDVLTGGFDENGLTSGTSRSFSGKGNATQSNSLTGRLSVTVVRVLPGGNLEIIGQKRLTLNNGQEYVQLRGIVRPSDISSDNVVSSDRIAHAEIRYVGAGDIADTAKQGWLSRAFATASPF